MAASVEKSTAVIVPAVTCDFKVIFSVIDQCYRFHNSARISAFVATLVICWVLK